MLLAPKPLGATTLEPETLEADRKACRRFGPCGLGERAIYLGGRFAERCFYVPYGDVRRVFKRVAMSSGGYTGKGLFGSMAYVVVLLADGREKQSYCKYEDQIDKLLSELSAEHPEIPIHSEAAERKLREAEAAERARYLDKLSPEAEAAVRALRDAQAYLQKRPARMEQLVSAAKHKRVVEALKPSTQYIAAVIAVLGVAAALWGAYGLLLHRAGAGYWLAGGGVLFFSVLAAGVLPSRWNSRKEAQRDWDAALESVRDSLGDRKDFPVPPQYAHPAVLERMIRSLREGRAADASEAYALVKSDLKALNSSVTVTQKEYDEVVQIKPLFLVCGYEDKL